MRLAPLAIILPAAFVPGSALHAAEYLTIPLAQKQLFPAADRFVDATLQLTDTRRAEQQGRLLGWFIVDEVVGKHEFITYATAIAPDRSVLGVEILVYRETYG